MSKEKVIEIKINDVTYIVSEVNRNDVSFTSFSSRISKRSSFKSSKYGL